MPSSVKHQTAVKPSGLFE